jgi:23S rRNA (cytidine1920-2'-O)/16S rRNA (cytidine1409-2'-O)-methyltransferase
LGRADVELVARGLAPSRSAAQRLIADGAVFVAPGGQVGRSSQQVGPGQVLRVEASDETRFVSRAGAKLLHALHDIGIDPTGLEVLDLGMSTGGFADCLLQAGASRVVGIEVGHGQLHPSLREDRRIVCLERTNLREATPALLASRVPDAPAKGFPMAVADLSFISLTKVLDAIDALLAPSAVVLLLVKPQFELSPAEIDGRGVVADPTDRERAIASVAQACGRLCWTVHGIHPSALPGGDGNRESFLHASTPAIRTRRPEVTP